MPAPSVAFVLKGYPRLSETFIAQEIRALEARGLDIHIYSLRHPTDPATHPVHGEIVAPIGYLPEYLHDEPLRVWRALLHAWKRRGFRKALGIWLGDLRHDLSRNRIRRFGQALVLAWEMPEHIGHIHAHFLHTPASVARYAAALTGLPWSCSAHAKDIWTTPILEIKEKLADMGWLVTCTAAGRDHLAAIAPTRDRVSLVYHGLDFERFPAPRLQRSPRDGSDPGNPVQILSVGRAVPKKGYETLIEALALLPPDMHWEFSHVGSGPDLPRLIELAERRRIWDRITWFGPQAQDMVLSHYREADLFVLASEIAADGDRDGLPNVLMEAQSQGVACLSTRVSAIPELIDDGATGVLVEADDPKKLADALRRLIGGPDFRSRIGAAGAARLRREFGMDAGIDALADRFGLTDAGSAAADVTRCASSSTRR